MPHDKSQPGIRTTWGPVQYDGTLFGLLIALHRLQSCGAPPNAQVIIGPQSYAGAQVSVRSEKHCAS